MTRSVIIQSSYSSGDTLKQALVVFICTARFSYYDQGHFSSNLFRHLHSEIFTDGKSQTDFTIYMKTQTLAKFPLSRLVIIDRL